MIPVDYMELYKYMIYKIIYMIPVDPTDDHNGFQVSGTKTRYMLRNLIRRNYIPCTFEGNK